MLEIRTALRSSLLACAAAAWVALASPSPARADIPAPDVEACFGKKPGDACSGYGIDSGRCSQTTCSRIRPGPNGTDEYTFDCVKCISGSQTPPAQPDDPAASPGPQKVAPGPTNKSSGCSAAGPDSDAYVGIALVGMGLGVLALARRKRKSS